MAHDESTCEPRSDRRRSGIRGYPNFFTVQATGNRFSKNERQLDYAFRSSYSDGSFLSLLRGARTAVDFETMPLVERRERITVSETLLSIFPALHTVPLFFPSSYGRQKMKKKKKGKKQKEKRDVKRKRRKLLKKRKKEGTGKRGDKDKNMEQRLIVVQFERWLVIVIIKRR